MPKKGAINLLPQKDFDQSPFSQFLRWILTYGRYIIIGTEIIVLLAFLSRFKLDRDLTDLSESIKTKKAIVTASQSLENNVRSLQNRLATIKNLEGKTISSAKLLESLGQITPPEITFSEITLQSSQISLGGKTVSLSSFALFLNKLSSSKKFTTLNLEKISQTREGIDFTLKADWVNQK